MARCTPRTTFTLSSPSRHSISLFLSLCLRPRQRRTQQKGLTVNGSEDVRQARRQQLDGGREISFGGGQVCRGWTTSAGSGRPIRMRTQNTCGAQTVSSLSLFPLVPGPSVSSSGPGSSSMIWKCELRFSVSKIVPSNRDLKYKTHLSFR